MTVYGICSSEKGKQGERSSTRESRQKAKGGQRDVPSKLTEYMDSAGHNDQGGSPGLDPNLPPTADGGPLRYGKHILPFGRDLTLVAI